MKNLIKKITELRGVIKANPNPFIFVYLAYVKFMYAKSDISNFFTFRLDGYETIFIAENSLALLTGGAINCQHIFHFFNDKGVFLNTYKVSSMDFNYKFIINDKITGSTKFGGFTHHVSYSNKVTKEYKDLLTDLPFQHRGYSGFRRNKQYGFSYVHGNFGSMYINRRKEIKSLTRLERMHTYTPQFTIKPNYNYEFIFSNIVNKKTCVKFFLIDGNSVKKLKEACIEAHATYKLELNELNIQHDCNITWETNLSVGRCLVFEYGNEYFDVFHS